MDIKNLGTLVMAAAMGSAITIGSYKLIEADDVRLASSEYAAPVVNASYDAGNTIEVPVNFTDAAEKVMDAVVHIRSTQTAKVTRNNSDIGSIPEPFREFFGPYLRDGQRGQQGPRVGSGSGVIISNEGYIVTNNHVIDQADELEVTLHNNKSYPATVIGVDPTTDIALIKIEDGNLPSLSLSDSDNARVGEWVLAVGNPFNLNSTVTAGIISAKARNIGIIGDNSSIESFIQTDAAVNPGNSGGALVNLQGDLVGINTAIASPTGSYSGYSFAVPSNLVSKVVEDLINYGTVQRGWLGVSIQNISNDAEEHQDLEVTEGAYVAGFAENSSAEEAGIKPEDVITGIDGKGIKSTSELIAYVGSKRPGDQVNILVNRDGKEIEYPVILKNKEGNTEIIKEVKNEMLLALGIDLVPLGEEELEELEISSGVKVSGIKSGKIRKYTDMREGFVITKIDGKKVKDVEDVLDELEGKEGGILIEGMYSKDSGSFYYGLGI